MSSTLTYTVALPAGASSGTWELRPEVPYAVAGSVGVVSAFRGDINNTGKLVAKGGGTALVEVPASGGFDAGMGLLQINFNVGAATLPGKPIEVQLVETTPGVMDIAYLINSGRGQILTRQQADDILSLIAQTTTAKNAANTAASNANAAAAGVADLAATLAGPVIASANAAAAGAVAASGMTAVSTYAAIPSANGYYRVLSGAEAGWVYQRSGGTLTPRPELESVPAQALSALNIKTFGVTGAGLADESATIQIAINAAVAVGATLHCPAGTYIAKDLVIPGPLILTGDGKTKTTLKFAAGGQYLISVNPGTGGTSDPAANIKGLQFRDLKMIGRGVEDGFEEHKHLVNLNAVSDVVFRNVAAEAWQGDAVYLGSGGQLGLERHNTNVKFYACDFDGVTYANRNCISVIDCDGFYTDPACTFARCSQSGQPGAIDFEPNYQTGTDGKVWGVIRNVEVNGTFTDIPYASGVTFLLPPQDSLRVPATNFRVNAKITGCNIGLTLSARNTGSGGAAATGPTTETVPHNYVFDGSITSCTRPFLLDGAKGAKIRGQMRANQSAAYIGYTKGLVNRDIEIDADWRRGYVTPTANAVEVRTVDGLKLLGTSSDAKGRFVQFMDSLDPAIPNTGARVEFGVRVSSPTGQMTTAVSVQDNTATTGTAYQLDYGSCRWLPTALLESAAFANQLISDGSFQSAAPTVGTWKVGARVFNKSPVLQGSGTNRYYTRSWVCLTAGTPGTWLAEYIYLDAPGVTTSVLPRPSPAIAATVDLSSSAAYANMYGTGLTFSVFNGGTNGPGGATQGVLTTFIDTTYSADGIGFSWQMFTQRGTTSTAASRAYLRFGNSTAASAWGPWEPITPRSGTTAQRPTPTIVGESYFDVSLGKPIHCKTVAGPVWVDAAGTTV